MDTVTIDEATAFKSLIKRLLDTKKYSHVVTTGRGGLSVAQRVAYALDLPVVLLDTSDDLGRLTQEVLFVDDIVCTGDTVGLIPRCVDTATLVYRKGALHKPTFTGLVYEGQEYIKFSWEY